MAQLIINVPDDQLDRVLTAFAATYGYQELVPADPPPPTEPDPNAPPPDGPVVPSSNPTVTLETKPNPESKRAFTKRMLQQHVLGVVRAYEVTQATTQAQDTAGTKVDQEVILS